MTNHYAQWTDYLTPTERRLLICLVDRKGEIVPYADVWAAMFPDVEFDLKRDSQLLRSHLCNFRAKAKNHLIIRTVPRQGVAVIRHEGQEYTLTPMVKRPGPVRPPLVYSEPPKPRGERINTMGDLTPLAAQMAAAFAAVRS